MVHTSPILVIGGSTRGNRRSPRIAEWIAARGRAVTAFGFATVDLKALGLTFDDEPGVPAKGVYVSAATRRWSEHVAAAAGIVFVTPQYNWGYPAPLKNAIDHLYAEWKGKPALIVTYGGHGGDKCARQLREVLNGVNMRVTIAMPGLTLSRDKIVADDGAVDPDVDFATHGADVDDALRELAGLCETSEVTPSVAG